MVFDPLEPARRDLDRFSKLLARGIPAIEDLERELIRTGERPAELLIGWFGGMLAVLHAYRDSLKRYRMLLLSFDEATREEGKRLTTEIEQVFSRFTELAETILRLHR